MIKAIIFDMDGVIVKTEDLWDKATLQTIAQFGKDYNRDISKSMCVGKGFRESCQILIDYYDLDTDVVTLMNIRREMLTKMYYDELVFIDGFKTFFEQKVLGNYKTCVATASDQSFIDIVEEKLGLYDRFSNKVYSIADVNFRPKPDPAVFLFAAEQIGIAPDECVVIEDSPHGIKAAKAAGMKCIGLATTFSHEYLQEADVIVNSYEEIDLSMF